MNGLQAAGQASSSETLNRYFHGVIKNDAHVHRRRTAGGVTNFKCEKRKGRTQIPRKIRIASRVIQYQISLSVLRVQISSFLSAVHFFPPFYPPLASFSLFSSLRFFSLLCRLFTARRCERRAAAETTKRGFIHDLFSPRRPELEDCSSAAARMNYLSLERTRRERPVQSDWHGNARRCVKIHFHDGTSTTFSLTGHAMPTISFHSLFFFALRRSVKIFRG